MSENLLVVCSDTHGRDGPRLSGRVETAVAEAERVVHAGDFTTEASLDGFRRAADRLHAVHGNADDPAVRERLPGALTATWRGLRIAVRHRPEGGTTGLSLFGRERDADLVVFGHTHRPTVRDGDPVLLNPGSHADPRGNRPAHAEIEAVGDGEEGGGGGGGGDDPDRFEGRIVAPDGTVIDRFRIDR